MESDNLKVIIPTAGKGTRLYPLTHNKPKPMIPVNGKPIIGHILDNLKVFNNIDEIIIIVGYEKEQIIKYTNKYYSEIFNIKYINQEKLCGLGHAIYMAKNDIENSEILITLGDMIFKYPKLTNNSISIGIGKVNTPEKYGVVMLDNKKIIGMVEKPKEYISNLAMVGLYHINDTKTFLRSLEKIYKSNWQKEFQLTEVFQDIINNGFDITSFEVDKWHDCGNLQELFNTNQILSGENNG